MVAENYAYNVLHAVIVPHLTIQVELDALAFQHGILNHGKNKPSDKREVNWGS